MFHGVLVDSVVASEVLVARFGHLHQIFDHLDTSHDGKLSPEEFNAGMMECDSEFPPATRDWKEREPVIMSSNQKNRYQIILNLLYISVYSTIMHNIFPTFYTFDELQSK